MDNLSRAAELPDPTDAIEENLFALVEAFRRWPRAQVRGDEHIRWALTDVPFPLFNSVFAARMTPAQADACIAALQAQARARGVPLLWWTGPRTAPVDLGARLAARRSRPLG